MTTRFKFGQETKGTTNMLEYLGNTSDTPTNFDATNHTIPRENQTMGSEGVVVARSPQAHTPRHPKTTGLDFSESDTK